MRCIKIVLVDGLNKSMLTPFKRLQTYTHTCNKFPLIVGMRGYCVAGSVILEILSSLFIPIITYLGAV